MLPYGGNSDRFDEINEIVNDPMKARLLEGMKRAAKNHFEMDRMLRSLRRLVQRDIYDDVKVAIFYALKYIPENIPIEQLRASAVPVFDFTKDEELVRLVKLLFETTRNMVIGMNWKSLFHHHYLTVTISSTFWLIFTMTKEHLGVARMQ